MSDAPETKPPVLPALHTQQQAINYLEDTLTTVETARLQLDIEQDAVVKRKLYGTFLVRHGYATGAIDVLRGVGLLEPTAYDQLKARCLRTMLPSTARGIVVAGSRGPHL